MGIVAGAFCLPAHAAIDPYQGAVALMDNFSPSSRSTSQPSRDAQESEYARLKTAVSEFPKRAATLTPEAAARQWLALFDRCVAMPEGFYRSSPGPVYSAGPFNVLPGPATWPFLQKMVESRAGMSHANAKAEAGLLFILHTLNNDEPKQWADLERMTASNGVFGTKPSATLTLGSTLSLVAGQPADAEAFWTRTFSVLAARTVDSEDSPTLVLKLPDFVTLFGEAKAEVLLTQALTLPKVKITEIFGEPTKTLARKVALAQVSKIGFPPWTLTHSLSGNKLYEALKARFSSDDSDHSEGEVYHILSLVVDGKIGEAIPAMAQVKSSYAIENAITRTANSGYGEQVYTFLKAFLADYPESGSWSSFVTIAARTGHGQAALNFVKETLARKDLTGASRAAIQPSYYRALLAVDQVEAGVDALQALIKTNQENLAAIPVSPKSGSAEDRPARELTTKLINLDIDLAKLGVLLKREELVTEAVDDARTRSPKNSLITFLINNGRTEEAETLLLAVLDADAQTKVKVAGTSARSYYSNVTNGSVRSSLVQLTTAYYNAGQWEKILALLEKSPAWGTTDLVTIAGDQAFLGSYPSHSLSLMAARALVETGKTDLARPILEYSLQIKPSDDAAYLLLLKIGQGDLVAKLDALYQLDQFENRPLIWKATVLLQQGKIAEAEEAAKAAIVVDPSDGHTGKGDRMRVYSVMAEICDAKKDEKQAVFFRNVVRAIRLSEDADDYYSAGLISHAAKMYSQALDLFSNAYCIQSRLARQLAQLGRMEEAAVHYRKAFELMPVSFGRMESHCFGCERAFEGKTASEIARQVFTEMLIREPDKPQIYYLRGYLETEEDQFPEALADYGKAVELDPDYINAWKKIIGIGREYQLNPVLGDEAFFNVLRLDPGWRHERPDTGKVRQLARLWTVVEAANLAVPPAPATLYPLKASAAQIAEAEAMVQASIMKLNTSGTSSRRELEQWKDQLSRQKNTGRTPRELVLRSDVIEETLNQMR